MCSNKDELYIKITDPGATYNFIVIIFFIRDYLELQIIVLDYYILKIIIFWIFQHEISDVDKVNTKVIVVDAT